jgi:hypothetical protein
MLTWQGVPYYIDAATKWLDGKTYFFKDKVFYEFDDLRFRVKSPGVPNLSAPMWMGCPTKNSNTRLKADPHMVGSDQDNNWDTDSKYRHQYSIPNESRTLVNSNLILVISLLIGCSLYQDSIFSSETLSSSCDN